MLRDASTAVTVKVDWSLPEFVKTLLSRETIRSLATGTAAVVLVPVPVPVPVVDVAEPAAVGTLGLPPPPQAAASKVKASTETPTFTPFAFVILFPNSIVMNTGKGFTAPHCGR
ncbi:hypothetical protein [Variovorax sp. PvP013]|uniref:hypothetical protein n=1 Tax=Variovorax sp. PvP013 TaxID=3156435 RepID=UPI003D1E4B97